MVRNYNHPVVLFSPLPFVSFPINKQETLPICVHYFLFVFPSCFCSFPIRKFSQKLQPVAWPLGSSSPTFHLSDSEPSAFQSFFTAEIRSGKYTPLLVLDRPSVFKPFSASRF